MTILRPTSVQNLLRSVHSLRQRRSPPPASSVSALLQRCTANGAARRPGRREPRRFDVVSRLFRRSIRLLNVHRQDLHRSQFSIFHRLASGSPTTIILHWTSPVLRQTLQSLVERTLQQGPEWHWHRQERSTDHRTERVTFRESVGRRQEGGGYPRLALTLVRSASSPTKAAGASSTADAPHSPTADELMDDRRMTRASRTEPPVLAEPELSRLTDHVIRQLDRRVLSYRERNGMV